MKHTSQAHHTENSHHAHHGHAADGQSGGSALHISQSGIETNAPQDDIAREAYAIYVNEGRPEGRDVQHWLEAESHISA